MVGFNDNGTVTVLHGTTARNAEAIRRYGFKASDPLAIARMVEKEYGLPSGSVEHHQVYQFAIQRNDLDWMHFTSSYDTASHYTVPEQLQDALHAAYFILHPSDWTSDVRDVTLRKKDWLRAEERQLCQPGEVLHVSIPWEAVGANAFGRVIGLQEYKDLAEGELPHSLSVPVSALADAKIVDSFAKP